jgi:hypothetical protein
MCGKGSLTVRGEYYWTGNCAAATTPSTTKLNTAAHTDGSNIEVGDRLFITDGYGADDNYNHFVVTTVKGVVDKGSNIYECELNDAADWGNIGTNCYYTIIKTSIGSVAVSNTERMYLYGLQSVLGSVKNFYCEGKSKIDIGYCYLYSTYVNIENDYPTYLNVYTTACVSTGDCIYVRGYMLMGAIIDYSKSCVVSGSTLGVVINQGAIAKIYHSFLKSASSSALYCVSIAQLYQLLIPYGTTTGISATGQGTVVFNAGYPIINKATTPLVPASSTKNPYIGTL